MKIFSYMIILLLLILGVTFALLNATSVTIHYYLGVSQLPLSLLLLISFAAGVIVALLAMGIILLRLKAQNLGLKRRLRTAEKEIENLRTLPIKEEEQI
ncbi:MAG: LapA family protein [Gammaproteobacteria bacterium]|nr:LapA family protein [Gammaproteobacteria bacterium]